MCRNLIFKVLCFIHRFFKQSEQHLTKKLSSESENTAFLNMKQSKDQTDFKRYAKENTIFVFLSFLIHVFQKNFKYLSQDFRFTFTVCFISSENSQINSDTVKIRLLDEKIIVNIELITTIHMKTVDRIQKLTALYCDSCI